MKRTILKYCWLPALLALASCWKEPIFPDEPTIEFSKINNNVHFDDFKQTLVNEITVGVNFKDGDGNLGLTEADTTGIFERKGTDPATGQPLNKFYNNYFIEAFIEKNGEFVPANDELVPGFPLVTNGRFLPLSPDGKRQAIEGELRFTFEVLGANLPLYFQSGDRIKFRVQIVDKSLNASNTVETDPVQIIFQ